MASLCNTDQSMLSYLGRAWLIGWIPSIVIQVIAGSLIDMTTHALGFKFIEESLSRTVSLLFTAPWSETLAMWPMLSILTRLFRNSTLVAAISGVIFGALHGIIHPTLGIATTWGFFVLSVCFLEWKKKSRFKAIIMTAFLHMCLNAPAALVTLTV